MHSHLQFALGFSTCLCEGKGFPGGSVIKSPSANAGDSGSISGSGRSTGGGNEYPLQYSCLGNFMDRGAWWAIENGITKELYTI